MVGVKSGLAAVPQGETFSLATLEIHLSSTVNFIFLDFNAISSVSD